MEYGAESHRMEAVTAMLATQGVSRVLSNEGIGADQSWDHV